MLDYIDGTGGSGGGRFGGGTDSDSEPSDHVAETLPEVDLDDNPAQDDGTDFEDVDDDAQGIDLGGVGSRPSDDLPPSATTGLTRSDDPAEENAASDTYADEDTAPPDSTTGLGGSMGDDPVSERNEPADVEPRTGSEELADEGLYMPGSTYENDPEAWEDASTTEDGNSPGGTGNVGSSDPVSDGAVTGGAADAAQGAADAAQDAADTVVDTTTDVVDDAVNAAENATSAVTPDWLDWLANNQEKAMLGLLALVALYVTEGTVGTTGS